LEKIQFASSGQMLLSRPDKLRATRTGGYADIELVFDGKTATLLGKNINAFAQFDTPGSVDQLVDLLRNQLSVELPGTDLLNANAYDALMSDVIDAKHMGQGVIDGVDCEHLAFRSPGVNWEIWIESGSSPLPRRLAVTFTDKPNFPRTLVEFSSWNLHPWLGQSCFVFRKPAGGHEIPFRSVMRPNGR